MTSWQKRDLAHVWHPCSQMKDYETLPPIVIDHAKGVHLYDDQGKDYLDVVSSWWCNLLGHCNPKINAAVKAQVDTLEHVIFANFSHTPAIRLCEGLCEILPEGLNRFCFTDNGSSAVEAAMKLSFQYHYQTGNPQKQRFMSLTDAYHGETVGCLSAGAVDMYAKLYRPMLLDVIHVQAPDCYRCPYGQSRETCSAPCFVHAERALEEHGGETCAFLVEPLLQGAAGMKMYPPVYLKKLRQACSAQNVHLIADEIATGFGRTGELFACNHADITPDIICLSKGLTGGYMPMAMAVATEEIYGAFYGDYNEGKAFLHSHTYSGNPLACSTGLAVLDILKTQPILQTARENAPYLTGLLKDAMGSHPHLGELRHLGLIHALELVRDPNTKEPFDGALRTGYRIYQRALQKGLLLRPLGDVLYFNPPLTITRDEMETAVRLCRESITDILG